MTETTGAGAYGVGNVSEANVKRAAGAKNPGIWPNR